MGKLYFSDIKNETWYDAGNSMRYILVPTRWWSIKEWLLCKEFERSIQLFFMKKV